MTGMLIQMGLGWVFDPASGPNHVRTATPAEYVAEIHRLHDELQRQRRGSDRWCALMASSRLRLLGWAGFGSPKEGNPADANGYRHMGLELWTLYDRDGLSFKLKNQIADENSLARNMLESYACATMDRIKEESTMPVNAG